MAGCSSERPAFCIPLPVCGGADSFPPRYDSFAGWKRLWSPPVPIDLRVYGAAEHNLKNIDVEIPRNTLTVVTGLSGSGKSSLAFDTIYAEGQRRYVESLSSYARQFLDQMPKPHVEHIEGLSPAISIEQKTVSRNPRSTVGTVTEIYDYMRLLFANAGRPHCPVCLRPLERQSLGDIVDRVMELPQGTRLLVMAPVVRGRKGEYQALFQAALKDGIVRAKVDGEILDLDPELRLKRQYKHDISLVIDRFIVRTELRARLVDSVELALRKADGLALIETLPDRDGKFPKNLPWQGERIFSQSLACPDHGPQIVELAPRMFSFNSPYGACPKCNGIGTVPEVNVQALVPNGDLSLMEGAVLPWRDLFTRARSKTPPIHSMTYQMIQALARALKFDLETPWNKLPKKVQTALLEGTGDQKLDVRMPRRDGSVEKFKTSWEGLVHRIRRSLQEDTASEANEFLHDVECPACGGSRLKPESLAVSVGGRNISEVCHMSIGDAAQFFDEVKFTPREELIAAAPLREIRDRLGFLLNVGLHYLTLDRHAGTLSGGEAQRIRLATQIGSQLVGVLYILDEPSIGLHQRDNERLIGTLENLRDLGNTVIVVEHDEQTIRTADHVIDLGPGAGSLGGFVAASGTPEELVRHKGSLTGRYLNGELAIETPAVRRAPDPERRVVVRGARHHNLRGIDAAFPLGMMLGITGVSGSGKSSLVVETLVPALMNKLHLTHYRVGAHDAIEGLDLLDKVIAVDQSPIGRTPRSNPATYTKVLDSIRELFAATPEARMRGYTKGRFSFNVAGGRCEECSGDGVRRIEMHFLPDVYVECEACGGRRYNRETLEVLYRGKSIADVLDMTIEEAVTFFEPVPSIASKLRTLYEVGLGYITLGQRATTLSGGEAQRVKLSRELSKRNTGRTLYVLDEPTTGLHFEDVRKLIEVLNRLVDAGSTVVIIEHNLDVIKSCDWLLDLGPEGGKGGGAIVAEGPPEVIAATPESETGRFLARMLPTVASTVSAKAPAKKAEKKAAKKAAKKAVKKASEKAKPAPKKPAAKKKTAAKEAATRKKAAAKKKTP
ncbi:MAG: excinuclease subunit [Candidatus Sumerlaeota bacterium]|nr:excinuclease subunit [Candidatus Sumerlaeota bacterium]